MLATSLASAQKPDYNYSKKKLNHTEVGLLFSYYKQDNNHSAVTGGIGTEKLSVYAQQLSVDFIKDSTRAIHLDAGVDIISSASTDNIDFVRSSASRRDGRYHSNVGYSHFLENKLTSVGGNFSFSLESDYLSFGPGISIHHTTPSGNREITLAVQAYFDDLRWFDHGRLSELIYPFELRYKEWFDIHTRNSYNFSLAFYQTLNRRMAIGLYPGLSYQKGLLSTPFHRVYFDNDTRGVEKFPGSRLKVPIGAQLNSFIGSRVILRLFYRYYWDDFDITANTYEAELPIKLSRKLTLTPFMRWYDQTAAPFFRPYKEHEMTQEYYTSDYDMSSFTSMKPGVSIRFAPYSQKGRTTFEDVEIRFAHYERSDGMKANMISLYFGYDVGAKQKNFRDMN